MRAALPRRVAVVDVGKTNAKLVVFDGPAGPALWSRTAPNRPRRDGPYPHADVGAIESFLIDALADAAAAVGVDAVSITAHGAAGALIAGDSLALPMLDYEHGGPDVPGSPDGPAAAEAYAAVRPPFAETFSPRLPGGLNLGAQLFWQARAFPDAFARAEAFVTHPQYWAWRLTGVAATEPTSLGCHTDLWAPGRRDLSSLVARMGWGALMAPVRSAFDVLGPLRPAIAARVGLGPGVPVACGIHDSNASLLPHLRAGGGPQTVVSTGTWVVAFAVGAPLGRLDAARDTLANVDAFGRPVPSARFMGGREFELMTGGRAVDGAARDAAAASVVARGVMALPGFVRGSGPFPRGAGGWSHDPVALSEAERAAAASLCAALTTAACLDLLGAAGPTAVDGPFARDGLYLDALARLTGRAVSGAPGTDAASGAAAGAARLFAPDALGSDVTAVLPAGADRLGPDLARYAARWREAAERSRGDP